ncbi:MAG: hypothetical protein Q7S39_08055 [Ignavibacteria bacterium]|nr:hypothetical protein [Ignavibacteria bacterium]
MSSNRNDFTKFITDIIKLYQVSKKRKQISERIIRGRNNSISSLFEERVAKYLDGFLTKSYTIYVDYPISYSIKTRKRKKTSYPDICIVKNNRILSGIIELKIDLGYLSPEWTKKTFSEFVSLQKSPGVTFSRGILQVRHPLARAILILTSKNDHGRLTRFHKQSKCKVFVLSRNIHPNDIKRSSIKSATLQIVSDTVNLKNWNDFTNFIQQRFS